MHTHMNNKILLLALATTTFFACGGPAEPQAETPTEPEATVGEVPEEVEAEAPMATGNFGEEITADGAIPASEVPAHLVDGDSVNLKVAAHVDAVCKKKGCWMTVKLDDEQEMMVRFKDYGFFVPLDCDGKNAVMEGKAFHDTTTVEMLRHYAEDAGKSAEEIEAITEPEVTLSFLATGVIITDEE